MSSSSLHMEMWSSHLYMDHMKKMGEEGEGAGQEGEEGEKGLLSEPLIIIFQSDLTPMQDAKPPPPPHPRKWLHLPSLLLFSPLPSEFLPIVTRSFLPFPAYAVPSLIPSHLDARSGVVSPPSGSFPDSW